MNEIHSRSVEQVDSPWPPARLLNIQRLAGGGLGVSVAAGDARLLAEAMREAARQVEDLLAAAHRGTLDGPEGLPWRQAQARLRQQRDRIAALRQERDRERQAARQAVATGDDPAPYQREARRLDLDLADAEDLVEPLQAAVDKAKKDVAAAVSRNVDRARQTAHAEAEQRSKAAEEQMLLALGLQLAELEIAGAARLAASPDRAERYLGVD